VFLRLRIVVFPLACALLAPGLAHAAGGSYAFDGGTAKQRAEVRAALEASAFDWSLVPATVTIHVAPGHDSEATRGNIWLDADLLNSGRFAWGVIQHEYAHQVDFFLLDEAKRAQLLAAVGGDDWCSNNAELEHGNHACERFASTLAWAYWQSADNVMRPQSANDESAAMAPAQFRQLLATTIGAPSRALASKRLK
jgi:hypothetical protein